MKGIFPIWKRDTAELAHKYGDKFDDIPTGALGLYSYYERLSLGLRQLMCGARKFGLEHISRDDIAALDPRAAEISGIPYVTDVDKDEAAAIISG